MFNIYAECIKECLLYMVIKTEFYTCISEMHLTTSAEVEVNHIVW